MDPVSIGVGTLILLGLVVLGIGILIGIAIGWSIWGDDPGELRATWQARWNLTPEQANPSATGFLIDGNVDFDFEVFATIPGLPGNHGLNGVAVAFAQSGTGQVDLTNPPRATGSDGHAKLQTAPVYDGDATISAEVTIDGVTRKLTTPQYEVDA